MKQKTFVIEYTIFFKEGEPESHTTKVKNCLSDLHAKIKLEKYLRGKHYDFKRLKVRDCQEDVVGFLSNMFGF